MKEAAGEANMTVITIILIAIVLGVGTIIITSLMKNVENSTSVDAQAACTNNGGTWTAGQNGAPGTCSR